jgi:hypothetical protein
LVRNSMLVMPQASPFLQPPPLYRGALVVRLVASKARHDEIIIHVLAPSAAWPDTEEGRRVWLHINTIHTHATEAAIPVLFTGQSTPELVCHVRSQGLTLPAPVPLPVCDFDLFLSRHTYLHRNKSLSPSRDLLQAAFCRLKVRLKPRTKKDRHERRTK